MISITFLMVRYILAVRNLRHLSTACALAPDVSSFTSFPVRKIEGIQERPLISLVGKLMSRGRGHTRFEDTHQPRSSRCNPLTLHTSMVRVLDLLVLEDQALGSPCSCLSARQVCA